MLWGISPFIAATDMEMDMKIDAEKMKINALVNMKTTLNTVVEKN